MKVPTTDVASPSDFPQDQAERINICPLEGIEVAPVQGVIQDLRCHVPLCPDTVVLGDVYGVRGRNMPDGEPEVSNRTLTVPLDQDVFALQVSVSDGRLPWGGERAKAE